MPNDLQKKIESMLNAFVAEGKERGVQVAVYLDGKLAVDAWAGVADVRTGRAVDGDTLFPVFSTTKGIMSTVIHLLAERGQIDYDAPVARYWPEFAANGKESITVRHALAHTSGIPYMPDGIGHAQLSDWDFMCRAVAQLKPYWLAGERQIYHPVTFGWILGEVARRVDGRPFQPFIEAEICRPLGLTTMFCGVPDEVEPEVAFLEMISDVPEKVPPPPNDVAPCMIPLHEWMNRSDARHSCLPASSGIMNARAVARHYAALLPGGVDGVELLPRARVRVAVEEQPPSKGYGESLERKGLGYQLGVKVSEMGESPTAFGHSGYGGSIGFADPRFGLAVGVARNRFSSHSFAQRVVNEIHQALGA